MAYLLFAICLIYILLWGLGFIFSVRSKGKKQPLIPLLGLAAFLVLGAYSGQASKTAMDNPHKLTTETYDGLKKGMGLEEVEAVFGESQPDDRYLKEAGDPEAYDLGARGIRIHPTLSDLLGSTTHKDKIQAKMQLRIEGKAGPMGANLVRLEGKYQARKQSWEEMTRGFEKKMGALFTQRARSIQGDVDKKRSEQTRLEAAGKKMDAQTAGEVADRLQALASSYEKQGENSSYENIQFSMLKSDREGYIRRQGSWSSYGCSSSCAHQVGKDESCREWNWDCPVRDLQVKLINSQLFATVDQGRKTSNVTLPTHHYDQTFNRTMVVAQSGLEAGIGGEYKSIKDTHSGLAKLLGTAVAIPPEPPKLGLARWASSDCHQSDLKSGAILETVESEQNRYFSKEQLEAMDDDKDDKKSDVKEEVINKGVLGLELTIVENDSALIVLEGHHCEAGHNRYAETPETWKDQPGASNVTVNDQIFGFAQCKKLRGAAGKQNVAESCCKSLVGKSGWNAEASSCTSSMYYTEARGPFDSFIKSSVTAPCQETLKTRLTSVLRGNSSKADLEADIKSMEMKGLYDTANKDIDPLNNFGKGLLKALVQDAEGGWSLGKQDMGTLVGSTCSALTKWHTDNSKTTWEYAEGSKQPTWAGDMLCMALDDDDGPAGSDYYKSRVGANLSEDDQKDLKDSTLCVWWYTDGMRKEDVTKTISDGVAKHYGDVYSTEIKSKKVQFTHAAERNFGKEGNSAYGQVTSGANSSAMVTFGASSKSENFTGGKPAATLKVWEEKGVVLDSDFSGDDRLIVAGFIDGELSMWRETGILNDEAKLTLKAITPSSGPPGEAMDITIEGNSLHTVKKLTIGGVLVEHDVSEDGKIITATVPASTKEGIHNVEVEATGMNTSTLINGLRLEVKDEDDESERKASQSSGCSARADQAPIGSLALMSLLGLCLGLRRRA